MSWIMDRLEEMGAVVHIAQPLPGDTATDYEIIDGKLVGEGVFYVPTAIKFYNRPKEFVKNPVCGTLHYTAIHASNRPLKHLDKLLNRADYRLDDTAGALIDLRLQLEDVGYIPDSVSLTLQNAGKDRNASWCLCIGSQPLPSGKLPITQYSPNLDTCGTMHAGSPTRLWRARKKFGKKPYLTHRGEVRWDGRNYYWPEVDVPGRDESLIISNINHYSIGIEVMNLGPYGRVRQLRFPGLPKVKIGDRFYEKPSDLMIQTIFKLMKAIRREYGDIPMWGHKDFTRGKIDPWPPLPEEV